MAGLKALKVKMSAQTTSFRYPRVQVGRLPTFDVPPPATIYGHLAGVIGDWFDPEGLECSYVFEHDGRADDLETTHPIERGPGKPTLAKRGWNYPVNVSCNTNVQRRQFLLRPRMTLYLKGSDDLLQEFQEAFISPYFAYVLGRSQDLATCHEAKIVALESSEHAFFENTILPFDWRPWVSAGTTILLPSVMDYKTRFAIQDRYLHVSRPTLRVSESGEDVTDRKQLPSAFAVDPEDRKTYSEQELARGLMFWPVRRG
jgi:CRISPR-associated protein Cas5t